VIRAVSVGLPCLLIITIFIWQIVGQLRSGKMRPRGSEVYKTRKDNPLWYWSSIATQIMVVLITLYFFSLAILKATSRVNL